MKILISTTQGHNPGDEIIRRGVERLLEAKFGPDIEYIHYNRNPDLQASAPNGDRSQRSGLVGNYMASGSILKHVDRVVLAGSPEWYGGPLEALYQGIKMYAPNIPLYAIGIGLGSKWGTLTPLDQEILSRPETKIVTRSPETTDMLAKTGIQSEALPCPALFAYDAYSDLSVSQALKRQTIERPLLILQKPGHGWHEVPERILEGVNPGTEPFDNDILCVHVKEYEYFMEMFEWESNYHTRVHYAGCTDSFARIVSQYQQVISTRLHGAIGALSLGCPATVVSDGDFRIETAAKMFGDVLPIAKTVRAALAIRSVCPSDKTTRAVSYLAALNAP